MGLAPYGKPTYSKEFEKVIYPTKDGGFKMDMSYFRYHYTGNKKKPFYSKKFIKIFGIPRIPESEITKRDEDLAATLQDATEKIGVHLAKYLYDLTKEKRLCLSGGVALNSVMNFKILQETNFDEVYIYPASHDGGTAIGAALYVHYSLLNNPLKPVNQSPYLGPEYSDNEIEKSLKNFNLKYEKIDNKDKLAKIGAQLIHEGKIIGWFQGRTEIGPRALGNRSILCRPYPEEMKKILNERVKHREGFRPFAPSAKIERYKEFFEIDIPSPYMLLVCNTRKEKLKELSAITHVDGTARLQTVSKEENELYWKLIDEYEKLSGIPVILNTSFNVRGEPIINSPDDAIKCFLKTHMDALIIGNFLVKK
jgi:carbamoyltransferase